MTRSLGPLLAALVSLGCGASSPSPPGPTVESAASTAPFRLTGTVAFLARQATSTGVSTATEERPARAVSLEARAADGAVLATTRTDQMGAYVLEGTGDVAVIDVIAVADLDGTPLTVALDESGLRPHRQTFQLPDAEARSSWDGRMRPELESSLNGALHILDTLDRGIRTAERWGGERLPELFVYWGPDITVDWSYYRGARGGGVGGARYCLELLAGRRSERATTDTDEHDEAIILHELGHFVFDRWSTYTSIGGRHPRGALVDPGVAWEEGRATWLATAIRRDPAYVDSRGVEGSGSARVDERVETPQPPRGPGSETSVAGVLWDLSDGDGDASLDLGPDTDADGLAVGPAAVLRAMRTIVTTPNAYPGLAAFLRHLIDTSVTSDRELRAMLAASGEPASVLDEVWPVDLALGASVNGHIDGLTQPAPSGGENRPENGYDAVRAFRVVVTAPGTLGVTLTPSLVVTGSERFDVTLELRNDRAMTLMVSAQPRGAETITVRLAPGTYIVYARDDGTGNDTDFVLSTTFTPD